MTEIHLTQELQSDTLTLPQLQPLIGRTVEIIIRDLSAAPCAPESWDALQALAGQDLVDPDAFHELRELDRQHWPADE